MLPHPAPSHFYGGWCQCDIENLLPKILIEQCLENKQFNETVSR
jgi:hypothetical protein